MKIKLFILCLCLIQPVRAINMKGLIYCGEILSGNIDQGNTIPLKTIQQYVHNIDVREIEVPKEKSKYAYDKYEMERFFVNDAKEIEEETINNFITFYDGEKTSEAERYGTFLLIKKTIENLH